MKISTTVTLFILIQNVIGSSPAGQPFTGITPTPSISPTSTDTPTTTITTTSTTATSTTTTIPKPTTPTNVNECETSPCENNTICNDQVNGYNCTCPPGYNGTHCETEINECDSSPCENNATCNDQVNGYNCTCLPGYNGTHCETGLLDVQIGGPYIVEEGKSVITLQCNISDSSTLLSVQWFKLNLESSQLITVPDSKGKYSGSMTSMPSLSIHQINQSDEACYICSAKNIAGWKNSSSVLLNVTDILPPKSIELQDISTTGFTIHIDQASFPLFNIKLNDTKKTNNNTNDTDYKIDELTPGTCYSIEVSTVVRDQFSKPVIQNICLSPAPPNSISKKKHTNDSLTFNIVHGKGKIDHFNIFINGIYKSSTTQDQKGPNDTTAVIHDLVPGTLYDQISVMTDTNGLKSSLVMMKPYATYPDPPADIEVIEPTDKCCISLNIAEGFGRTESFYVYVNDTRNITFIVSNTNYTTGNITDLLPGRFYQIQVAAFSNELESVKKSISAVTKPNAPQIKISTNSTTTKQIFGTISQMDGGSDKFELFCAENPNLNFSINHSNFIINDLEPGHRYQIQATATFHNHISDKSELIPVCTVPHKPAVTVDKIHTNTSMIHGTISQTIGGNDSFTLYVDDKKYSEYTITKSSYVIRGLNPGEKYKIQATTTFCSLESVKTDPVEECTDASPPLSVTTDIDKDSITFSITKGTSCVKYFIISIDEKKYNVTALKGKEMTRYTVNNLDPSTTYKVTISVVSKGAETSRQISFKTKNDPVPVIGGVIGAVLALLVIGIFVVSWRRQAMCFRKNKSTEVLDGKTNIGFEEEVEMADSRKKRPVKLTDFPRHVEYLSRNANMGFAAEFKELGVLSPKHSTNAAQLQENRPKNRYTNILPFDLSIVKLVGEDDEPGSDFINANFIPGKRSPREYIAAQGPLPATKEDMWSMIWEQNTSIVVMLTQIVERGRKKCEIYWPENLNEKMFLGDIIVEVETLSHLPDYVLRTIVLRLGDVEKRLRHYNYIAWPDMGTPATTDNMISFVDTVRKDIRPDMKGPIVVHCSAGVGRTGTFIVMDILLQEIRSQCKEVDIFGTILNLRNNRVNMVQTEDQYIFIHNCVRDFIEASDDEEEEVVDDEQPIYQNV